MNSVFDILEYKNLITNEGVQKIAIDKLTATEIFELADAIITLSVDNELSDNKSLFSHTASLSLGGSREDCAALDCRMSRVNELARFAMLYSDRVFIKNWFLEYAHIRKHFDNPKEEKDEARLRKNFYDDLYLLWKLRPLIENRYIYLFTPQRHTCPSCLAKITFGQDAGDRLKQEYERLAEEYFLNTSVKFRKERGIFILGCEGPETYFEHGGILRTAKKAPEPLASRPRIMNKVLRGESVSLSKTLREQLKLHEYFAKQVVKNVQFDLATAQVLSTSFLTNKTLHITFLQSLSNNQDVEQRNMIAYNHLTSMVPFIEDVDIHDLITLRNREEEAFVKYRHALNKAIDEFREGGAKFTTRDAQALYSDVVAPSLSTLEHRVHDAKRDLVKRPLMSIGALVGVISFGMYTGFLPVELIAMAKALGLSKVLYDVIEKSMSLGGIERNIKNEDLYFLWKVKRKSQLQ